MTETRDAIVLGLRIGGGALLLLGLYMQLGGRIAGRDDFGPILLTVGAIGALLLPWLLIRRRAR